MLLSVTNPQNIAYVAALATAMGSLGVSQPTAADYATFLAGLMTASVAWAFFCAAMVDRLFARSGAKWAKATYRLCAVAFVALALGTLRDLVWPAEPVAPNEPSAISMPR